jgi:DNA-binding response OmpR family regulator
MVRDEDYAAVVLQCEAELQAARQVIDRVLRRLHSLDMRKSEADPGHLRLPVHDGSGEYTSDAIGMQKASGRPDASAEAPFLLSYCEQGQFYRVGSRRLVLTDMERGILDLLWQNSPKPSSRDFIAAELASSPGSVEVLVSKLRQKLCLLSDGHHFIISMRLQGWALHPPLCDLPLARFERHAADQAVPIKRPYMAS